MPIAAKIMIWWTNFSDMAGENGSGARFFRLDDDGIADVRHLRAPHREINHADEEEDGEKERGHDEREFLHERIHEEADQAEAQGAEEENPAIVLFGAELEL